MRAKRNADLPLITLFAATLSASASAPPITASWINPKSSVIVRIAPCGAALCGRVTWASTKAQADAQRGGTARLIGTLLMEDFEADGPGSWRGRLFVPDIQQTAEATMRRTGPNSIEIRGCGLGGLVCKSQSWRRSSAVKRKRER